VRLALTVRFISRWCFTFPAELRFTAHFLSGRRLVCRLRGLHLRVYVLRLHWLRALDSLSRHARTWCWCLTAGVRVHGCVSAARLHHFITLNNSLKGKHFFGFSKSQFFEKVLI